MRYTSMLLKTLINQPAICACYIKLAAVGYLPMFGAMKTNRKMQVKKLLTMVSTPLVVPSPVG